jgi:hypothetical protein
MQKLSITLTAVAFALAASVLAASAQTQSPGASGLHAQIQNATPIKKPPAADGAPGALQALSGAAARIVAGAPVAGDVGYLFERSESRPRLTISTH